MVVRKLKDLRKLQTLTLSDETGRTIRPIKDDKKAYTLFFVEIIRIVSAFALLGVRNVAPEPVFNLLLNSVQALYRFEGDFTANVVNDLWSMLVDQKLNLVANDLLKLVILFKSYNPATNQLGKSTKVEQMAAKAFYFCRLQKLTLLQTCPDDESFATMKEYVQAYFKSKDTPFHRLCYLKGLAWDISDSEDVSPIIASSDDPATFTIGDIPDAFAVIDNQTNISVSTAVESCCREGEDCCQEGEACCN